MQWSRFNRLLELIPELRLEAAKPSLSEAFEINFAKSLKESQAKADEINVASQPYVQKQLDEMRTRFDAETLELSAEEREAEWKMIVAQNSQALQVDVDGQLEMLNAARSRLDLLETD